MSRTCFGVRFAIAVGSPRFGLMRLARWQIARCVPRVCAKRKPAGTRKHGAEVLAPRAGAAWRSGSSDSGARGAEGDRRPPGQPGARAPRGAVETAGLERPAVRKNLGRECT